MDKLSKDRSGMTRASKEANTKLGIFNCIASFLFAFPVLDIGWFLVDIFYLAMIDSDQIDKLYFFPKYIFHVLALI